MKLVAFTLAAFTALAPAAFAGQISNIDLLELEQAVPGFDVSAVTTAQALSILNEAQGDNLYTARSLYEAFTR